MLHLRELPGIGRVRGLDVSSRCTDGKILKAMVKINVDDLQGETAWQQFGCHRRTGLFHNLQKSSYDGST